MKLQEKAKKKISYAFTLMILLILIISSLTNNIYASEGTIEYGGSVSYSGSTVGLFHIDGKLAFCMDHEKKSPATGTEIAEKSVYSDQNVIKCLYYGWEGPEQWSGFNGNWEYGIVATSLALDHYINGSNKTVALDFISFIDNAPFPTSYLNFSNNNFTAYVQGDKQVTNSATINGNEGLSLKFNIPDDVTIVCENRGWNKTGGTVEVVNGDVIHFEAPLTKTGNWTSEQIANSYVWNAILCRSYDNNIQRLVRLGEKDPGTYTNISINFISLGNIELYKTDSKTGELIPNTEFTITGKDGYSVTKTTNSQGYLMLEGLIPGEYQIVETKPATYYEVNSSAHTATVVAGTTQTLRIQNDRQTTKLRIIKVDSRDNKTPISGVKFELYSSEDDYKNVLATKTTSDTGIIEFTNLRVGYTYKIKEVSTNPNYVLDEIEKEIIISDTNDYNMTISNEIKTAQIRIIKSDVDYNEIKLENVEFQIYEDTNKNGKIDNGEPIVDSIKTNNEGIATSKNLPIDREYIVVETKTKSDYILNTEAQTVKFSTDDYNKLKTLNYTNKKKEGDIHLTKVDLDNNRITLGYVGFRIYSEEFNSWIRYNEQTKLWDRTTEDDNNAIYYTNVNGEILFEHLRVGKYSLLELETNKWYNKLSEKHNASVEDNKTTELIVENELKKGSIEIIKIDADEKEVRLKGVKFNLLDKDGNILEILETDENGRAETKRYALRDFEELTLQEIETLENYELNNTSRKIILEEGQIKNIVFENNPKKGNIKIIKLDEFNNEIAIKGAKFDLYEDVDRDGRITNKDKFLETLETDENGIATSKDYRIDRNYLAIETFVDDSYILAPNEIEFKLKWNETTTKTITNRPKTIQIEVIKTDSEDNTIKVPDVEFTIYQDTNKNGIIDKEDKIIDIITTGENGRAVSKSADSEDKSKALRVGEQYILKETKHNIAYNEENVEKVLDFTKYLESGEYKEGLKETLNIENKPITTKVNPHKEDRDTHKPLAGAEFDIYEDTNGNGELDEEDKVVFHTATKEDGYSEELTFRYGTYFVKETKAPEGYTLDHIISKFTVESQDQKIEVNFADKIIENDVDIFKKANNDSIKYGIKKDEGIPETYFALYIIDNDGNIIDFAKDKFGNYIGEKIFIDGKEYYAIKTDETGNVQVTVPYGKYLFKEIKSHDLFLNDSEDGIIDVLDDGKKVTLEFYNTAVNLELDISKTGINQAQPNDVIRYDFPDLINKSNVPLNDFTWEDHLPSKYTKIKSLYTGIWNEDLIYHIFYKTNKNDYREYGNGYSTLENNFIDFESLGLNNENEEYITDFKVVFGTVKSGFTFIEAPFIFVTVDDDIKENDKWTNKTRLTGNYTDINGNVTELIDEDEHTTTTYRKELKITTLPRTGNDLSCITALVRGLAIILVIGMGYALIRKF